MITRETDYAIRAMVYLAIQDDLSLPVSSADLSAAMDIPYRFFRKIVLKLTDAKLVRSKRGKGGGLSMIGSPEKITLLQIMRAIDPNGVLMNLCLQDKANCSRSYFCGVHSAFSEVQKILDAKTASITLTSMAAGEKNK